MAPRAAREAAWAALAQELDTSKLDEMTREVSLSEAPAVAAEIMQGRVRGRVVVNTNR